MLPKKYVRQVNFAGAARFLSPLLHLCLAALKIHLTDVDTLAFRQHEYR